MKTKILMLAACILMFACTKQQTISEKQNFTNTENSTLIHETNVAWVAPAAPTGGGDGIVNIDTATQEILFKISVAASDWAGSGIPLHLTTLTLVFSNDAVQYKNLKYYLDGTEIPDINVIKTHGTVCTIRFELNTESAYPSMTGLHEIKIKGKVYGNSDDEFVVTLNTDGAVWDHTPDSTTGLPTSTGTFIIN